MIKVSIITVCYNSEKTIRDTIESVLGQDYPEIEYIIVDGESQDKTLSIIESYHQSINKIISEKDNGMYDALNKGIENSSGDILGILHSDDIFSSSDITVKLVNQIISSNFVKEIISLGGDINKFTTKSTIKALKMKYE